MPTYNEYGFTYNQAGQVYGEASVPTLKVEIAFPNGPFDTALTWTNVSTYVRSAHTHRGRQHELNQVDAGTASVTFDNRDARFNPWNTASPYYNGGLGLTPTKPIRLSATYQGVTYPLWQGFIDSWPMTWGDVNNADVTVACTDAFKLLNQIQIKNLGYSVLIFGDSPQVYWRMGEAGGSTLAMDSSANGYTAAIVAGATDPDGGAIVGDSNGAQLFSPALTTYMYTDGNAIPETGTSDFTVEFWIKLPTAPLAAAIFTKARPSTFEYIQISIATTGLLSFIIQSGYGTQAQTSTTAVNDNGWHHVVLTREGLVASLYIDNGLSAQGFETSTVNVTGDTQIILAGTGGPEFVGSLDEVAWYRRALTSAQIAQHYTQGHGGWGGGDHTGERIGRVLDLINWPTALRSLDVGNSVIPSPSTDLHTSALTYLQDVVSAESGDLFMGGDGKIVFHSRLRPALPPYTVSQVILGEDTGELPYDLQGTTVAEDDSDLWTEVSVTRDNGQPQIVSDATAVQRYGLRTLSRSGVPLLTDLEALDQANYLLGRYKDPHIRVAAVTLHPIKPTTSTSPAVGGYAGGYAGGYGGGGGTGSGPGLFTQPLSRDLQDRVAFRRRPPGGGDTLSIDALIEGVDHTIDADDWHTSWQLSPAAAITTYWVLDTSALDTDTRLAY